MSHSIYPNRFLLPRSFLPVCMVFAVALFSCSPSSRIARYAKRDMLTQASLKSAHVGISIYDPEQARFLYEHQGDKYFVPASNTKIPTCYLAMKYLGDSIPGITVTETEDRIYIAGTGDPTLLHPEFKEQPVLEFLRRATKTVQGGDGNWKSQALGNGWSWNDYSEEYMTERSLLPVYANVIRFWGRKQSIHFYPRLPELKPEFKIFSRDGAVGFISDASRERSRNEFTLHINGSEQREVRVPFVTSGELAFALISDTLGKKIGFNLMPFPRVIVEGEEGPEPKKYRIYSQATDSILKPMMHRSDNFFAEQMLLMVSNEKLGELNDARIIDTILKTDFNDLPQRPRWADGSGLSRYNLFTPQDFVIILKKMKDEFGMGRISVIFPTGGEGTISSYYKADSGYIYAKTGTLSGVVAFSGFLYTKKGKLLIFSTLINNHQASAAEIRRAVEKFLQSVRQHY